MVSARSGRNGRVLEIFEIKRRAKQSLSRRSVILSASNMAEFGLSSKHGSISRLKTAMLNMARRSSVREVRHEWYPKRPSHTRQTCQARAVLVEDVKERQAEGLVASNQFHS